MWWKGWGVGTAQHRAPPWASPSTSCVALDQLLCCSESPFPHLRAGGGGALVAALSTRGWRPGTLRPTRSSSGPCPGHTSCFLRVPDVTDDPSPPPRGTGTASGGSTNSANGKCVQGPRAEHGGASRMEPRLQRARQTPRPPQTPRGPWLPPRGGHPVGATCLASGDVRLGCSEPLTPGWREET